MALLGFGFTLLITALAIWRVRRQNKLTQGPFTFRFGAEGRHTSGNDCSQTISSKKD